MLAEGAADGLTALAGLVWTGLFLFFPLFNKDRMRVGDLLAGTWVVSAPQAQAAASTSLHASGEGATGYRFTDAQLDVYGVYELQTLEQVLRDDHGRGDRHRRRGDPRTRSACADDGEPDHDFLTAYYDAARARMERGLLFGKRRARQIRHRLHGV